MLPKLAIIAVIGVLTLGIAFWDDNPAQRHVPQAPKTQDSRAPAPYFSFIDINAQKHDLTDYKGKIIILNFWATWCAPCEKEFPDLVKLANKYHEDIVFIALSVDEQPEKIVPFIQSLNTDIQPFLTQPNVVIAHDLGKSISQDLYQSIKYPETYVIDRKQKIYHKVVGPVEEHAADLEKVIISIPKIWK